MARIYTRAGDRGTTGLLYGGRVAKDAVVIEANGAIDEAQAALGVARAEAAADPGLGAGSDLARLIVAIERDLWVAMAEVATEPSNRSKLVARASVVTQDMVDALESRIDACLAAFPLPREFVVPGEGRVPASLDLSRTVVRRAERRVVTLQDAGGLHAESLVLAYLNRLSDLLWALARAEEHRSKQGGGSSGPLLARTEESSSE